MKLLDTHCHLDLSKHMEKIVRELFKEDISIITMTTTPRAFKKNKEICKNNINIKVALGLHPQLVGQRENELDLLLRYLEDAKFIGEIGIDANTQHVATINQQIRVFNRIIDMCDWYGNKVISIHSVKSAELVLKIMEGIIRNKSNKYILHWFTGNQNDLHKAIELGCYFSVNKKMLNTLGGKNLIKNIPRNKILLETDAPFIDSINTLADIYNNLYIVVKGINKIRGENMSDNIEENSYKILQI
ncbi:MAG TPA: Qat anti-phage system TatD family nuclease QatD [Clostridium sp.]